MSKLGFMIGKGINLATKFAAGAGAFEAIGKGNKAAGVVKDIAGIGSNVQGGAGASLSDRIRAGLSGISPKFAYAENVRSQVEQRGVATALDREKLDQTREAQAEIDVKKATMFDPMSMLGEDMQANPRMKKHMEGLLKMAGSDLDGDGKTSVWEWEQVQERVNKDGTLQQGVVNVMDSEIEFADKNIATIKRQAVDLVTKYNTSKEGVAMSPSNENYVSLDQLREMANDPQVAGTLDKKLLESIHQLDVTEQMKGKFKTGRETALRSMSLANQKLQAETAKIAREGDRFESTKTLETFAMGMFKHEDGTPKQIADLTTEEIDQVIRRKLKEDPLKLQQTMDLRKEFNAINIVQEFESVDTRMNQIQGMMERTVESDMVERNAMDQVLINNFNKIMDDASVVRESEYARSAAGISLKNRLKGMLLKVTTGGAGLHDDDRRDLAAASKLMRDQYLASAQRKGKQYMKIAEAQGTDAYLIVTDPRLRGETQQQGGVVNQDKVNSWINK